MLGPRIPQPSVSIWKSDETVANLNFKQNGNHIESPTLQSSCMVDVLYHDPRNYPAAELHR